MIYANFKSWFLSGALILLFVFGLVFISFGYSKLASADCSIKPNPALGQDSITLSISSSGTNTYSVWVKMLTTNSTDNSLDLQVDGGCAVQLGGSRSIPTNKWTWVNYQSGNTGSNVTMNLASGSHTVLLTGDAPNVGVDQILFLDSGCQPVGDGSNCTQNPPPTVVISSPVSGKTVSGQVNLVAKATDIGTITSVQFKIDSSVVGTLTSPTAGSSYVFNWNSAQILNGQHTITAIATDAANLTSAQQLNFTVTNTSGCNALPSTPANLSATPNGRYSLNLSWSASTTVSGCALSQYDIYRSGSTSPIASINPPTATTFTDNGLKPGTTYSYYVTAIDSSGHISSASNSAKAKTAQ